MRLRVIVVLEYEARDEFYPVGASVEERIDQDKRNVSSQLEANGRICLRPFFASDTMTFNVEEVK